MKTKNLFGKAFLVLTLLVASFYTGSYMYNQSPQVQREVAIKNRASTLFAQAELNHRFPSNKLIALSIALEFHNYDGAETLLNSLELQGRSNAN